MPELRFIVASGTAQRRLLEDSAAALEKEGYVLSSRQEGGDWVSLLSDNMSGGLFDEKTFTVIDSAPLMGAMPKKLAPMAAGGDSIILLVYESDPSKFVPKEIVKRSKVIRAPEFPRWPRERQAWVSNMAKGMGVSLTPSAISLMVELLEDPEEIRRQLLSLSSLNRSGKIGEEDVRQLCMDDGSGNLLKLLDGVCEGKAGSALAALRAISRREPLVPIMTSLHNRMRLAWYSASCGRDARLFEKALGARNYAWRMAGRAAGRYGSNALGRFVTGLIRLSIEERSGRGSGFAGLELLLLELMS
jgi:DNA polymerase III delta subunit